MTNAFNIPKESAFSKDKRNFPTNKPKYHANFQPIALPKSSKNLPPKLMEKKK